MFIYLRLSGDIPSTLQSWPLLQYMNMKSNKFEGLITDTANLHFSDTVDVPGRL